MMIFILLGGLYTSIESMPEWARWLTKFNPVSYFIEVMRLVVLKGSGLKDIGPHLLIMSVFAVVLNSWAVISYRKGIDGIGPGICLFRFVFPFSKSYIRFPKNDCYA